jgi:purine-binding chemotaxis protein CheW
MREAPMSTQDVKEVSTYLTFSLGDETFALDVANVREVLDLIDLTKVPRTPDFMRGVINLRGSVVPVVDMRIKFGLPALDDTVDTCIIVTEVDLDGQATVIGALADSVREVFQISTDEIEPPPSIGMQMRSDFIRGMGKQGEEFIIILDVNRIFTSDELHNLTIENENEVDGTGDEVITDTPAPDPPGQ